MIRHEHGSFQCYKLMVRIAAVECIELVLAKQVIEEDGMLDQIKHSFENK